MVPRLLAECTPSSFHLGHRHSILANQTKMPKQFCFSKMHHPLQSAICLCLVTKQSQQSHLVTFLKVTSMFVTKGSNSSHLGNLSCVLGCEIKPSRRHWTIAMRCPRPNPQSRLSNWLSLRFNYLPCHSSNSSQRWMLAVYHLTSRLQNLKEKQINKPQILPISRALQDGKVKTFESPVQSHEEFSWPLPLVRDLLTLLTLLLSLTKNEHYVSHTSLLVDMKITDIICLHIIIDINVHIQSKARFIQTYVGASHLARVWCAPSCPLWFILYPSHILLWFLIFCLWTSFLTGGLFSSFSVLFSSMI